MEDPSPSLGTITVSIYLIEAEVASCVIVADILDHAGERLHVVGQQSLLHVIPQEVAEETAEVLMSRIREERA